MKRDLIKPLTALSYISQSPMVAPMQRWHPLHPLHWLAFRRQSHLHVPICNTETPESELAIEWLPHKTGACQIVVNDADGIYLVGIRRTQDPAADCSNYGRLEDADFFAVAASRPLLMFTVKCEMCLLLHIIVFNACSTDDANLLSLHAQNQRTDSKFFY